MKPEPRVRVTRTLVLEGPESWVRQTLLFSQIRPDRPLLYGRNGLDASIRERPRMEVTVRHRN